MKCLVTGGAGFIGSNVALELERQGHEVIVLDNFDTGCRENLEGFKGTLIDGDVCDEQDLIVDAIFHQASLTDPRYEDDKEMLDKNLTGFKNMVALAKKNNAKLVYASTAGLYGNGKTPMQEDQDKEILTAYGESKMSMDEQAAELGKEMHIVGLRYFNVFGPRESNKGRAASMILHLGRQMKAGKRPRIFEHGEQKRDHIYVKDCVKANICALDAPSGVYNVGTGKATSFNELIALLNHALGTDLQPEYIPLPYEPETYQSDTQADVKKARSELHFIAEYSLLEGIKEYMEMIL